MDGVKFTEINENGVYGEVEGYAVRFTDFKNKDLDGEYFTKNTFFGFANKLTLFYDHALNNEVGKIPIGYVEIEQKEDGVYAKGQINENIVKDFFKDELEKAKYYLQYIRELGIKGILGFSSGAVGHTKRRNEDGEIKQWILGELSLTPTPADPFNYPTIKSGREFSDKNKTRIKNIYEKAKEFYSELEALNKEFEQVDTQEPVSKGVDTQQIELLNLIKG